VGRARRPVVHTVFLKDETRKIINYNDSPDVGFNASINPYRGSSVGCIYCFARPNHEYLGFSAGLDFETKILVKEDAPELLRRELASPRWEPQVITRSHGRISTDRTPAAIDAAMPGSAGGFRNPVVIITKNSLVARDIDLLSQLARIDGVLVFKSQRRRSIPNSRASSSRAHRSRRGGLRPSRALASAGVPVGHWWRR
jgi:DNA repair photolyase